MRHAEAEVLLVDLRNQPGALAHVCEQLGGEHINIEYGYFSSGGRNGRIVGIFKVSNTEKAIRALTGSNNVAKKKPEPRSHARSSQLSVARRVVLSSDPFTISHPRKLSVGVLLRACPASLASGAA